MRRDTLERIARAIYEGPEPLRMLPFSRPARRARRLGQIIQKPYLDRRLRKCDGVVTNHLGVRLAVRPSDPQAHRLYKTRCSPNTATVQVWNDLIRLLRPNVVVDVGANYGHVSLSGRLPYRAQVYFIEPHPELADCLTRSISLNKGLRAQVYNVAASDREGLVTLNVYPESSGLSSIDDQEEEGATSLKVPATRLDHLIAPSSTSRLLVKLDVEGHEVRALRGMQDLLAQADGFLGLCEFGNLTAEQAQELGDSFTTYLVNRFTLERVPADGRALNDLVSTGILVPYLGDVIIERNGNPPDGPNVLPST